MMTTTTQSTEGLLVTTCPVFSTAASSPAADVNENNALKGPRLLTPAASMNDSTVPLVASPAAIVTSLPFSQVSSPQNIMGFPTGINLTISNGIINLKSAGGGESSLLVAPATSSLSTSSSLSSCVSFPSPITVVKGTLPIMSTPMSSVAVTTPTPALLGSTQVTNTPGHLRVPNPTTIQLRPQIYSALAQNNMAMAMQNRLSLPFPASGSTQNLVSPTSISPLRTITPGNIPTTSVLSQQQVQFQGMAPLRGGAVTIAAGSHPVQQQHPQPQMGAQPMSIRQATAFPLLLNRPITLAGRPQLITAQPTRLAPRQIGQQMALQMTNQQPVSGATIVPLYRPAQATPNTGMNSGGQASTPQFVNQVMPTTMSAMKHISFRPTLPTTKVIERPQKIPDARLLAGVPVNRLLRPTVPASAPSLINAVKIAEPAQSLPQSISADLIPGSDSQLKSDSNGQGTEENKPEPNSALIGSPQVLMAVSSSQSTAVTLEQDSVTSSPKVSSAAVTLSPLKSEGQVGSAEEKGKEGEGGASVSSDMDALNMMDWSDGIASLPGSNLKFKLNELGLVEAVTEDVAQPAKNVVDSAVGVNTTDYLETPLDMDGGDPLGNEKVVRKCDNCNKFGLWNTHFNKTSRFCSQACMSTFSARINKPVHSLLSPKMMLNIKKKKKSPSEETSVTSSPVPESDLPVDKEKLPGRKVKGFDWQAFLEDQKAVGAPTRLFKDPFPAQKNGFKVGMRLEGVDPKHQNLFCVLSVAETQGYRLRLHFDGFSECYDFWCSADSPFIFPVGWCEKNSKMLQPPKHVPPQNFNWNTYLRTTKCIAAPKNLFVNQPATMVTPSAFRVGMKLEAVDRKNTALICVATVTDILGDKILVHFDGWEELYDYWCDITSPYIHYVGWCQENARALSPPYDWQDVETFTWEDYLTQTKAQAVPARAFKPRLPMGFELGMKLEAVDRRNPILVRVATVSEIKEHQILIHFDGWPEMYDYYVDDDSPEIRPPGWCIRTSHNLQPPYVEETHVQGNCPTPGCNGVGHIKGAKYVGHHSAFGCPYSNLNMNKESTLQDRLGSTRIEEGSAVPLAVRVKMESGEIRKCPTPGCDSSGHITGKFTSHHRLSGCPLYEKNVMRLNAELAAKPTVRPGRGRKRKHFSFDETDSKDENAPVTKKERLSCSAAFSESIHQSVYMSSVPHTPSQEGPPYWHYHAKLLPGVGEVRMEEVQGWSADQVASFVGTLPGCREHEKSFRDQEIDGVSFLLLTQADIVKIMKVKLGPALKIFNSILLFRQATDL